MEDLVLSYGIERQMEGKKRWYIITKDGQPFDHKQRFGWYANAKLAATLLHLIDGGQMDRENGMAQVMKVVRLDEQRVRANENKKQRGKEEKATGYQSSRV